MKARQWVLHNKPTGHAVLSGPDATFKLQETELPPLEAGQLLLKTVYLSNDPAQRTWIEKNVIEGRMYVTPLAIGEPMRARGIAEVVESRADAFQKGALVVAACNWEEYHVKKAAECQAVRSVPGVSPTQFLGALGGTGFTAYAGLVNVVEAKAGESVVVSGAAGATGSMAVQIAKHIVGCAKVIGIAGSDEKCRWVESIGADVCINYKKPDWREQLAKATDGFVDVYFDNVGGGQLDFMLTRLKRYGRVAACGAIADYNSGEKSPVSNWSQIIMQRLNIKGFIVTDFLGEGGAAHMMTVLSDAAKSGKIHVSEENETVVPTKFEEIPNTWIKLFAGGNRGKLVTHITG